MGWGTDSRLSGGLFQVTYSSLIDACQKTGEWEKALGVLGAMDQAQVEPNIYTYNAALSAFEKGGEWEKALAAFESLVKQGLQPNTITILAVSNSRGEAVCGVDAIAAAAAAVLMLLLLRCEAAVAAAVVLLLLLLLWCCCCCCGVAIAAAVVCLPAWVSVRFQAMGACERGCQWER